MTISSLGRLHAKRVDRAMEERLGLFRGQAMLLMTLARKDGLMHSEIAEKLEISPAAATKVIKRMEELHYVQRKSDPQDERISRVFLREEGWIEVRHIRNIFKQVDEIMVSDLTPEEQETLLSLLARVHNRLLNDPFDLLTLQETIIDDDAS